MGWGTAVKWPNYTRKTQAYVSSTVASSGDSSVTYSVTGCARSGDGSGQYYASGYTARVELFYRIDGGGWHSLGSTTGTLNYNDSVGSITKTVTISRTTAAQVVDFAADVTSPSGYWSTATAQVSNTVSALASYTVSYSANGGSGAPSSQTKWLGKALTLSSTKPTRTGHSFSRWNTKSGGTGTSYAPGASYTANASATLYAQWTANTYVVAFDADGGSGAPASQTKVYGTTLKLSSTAPGRANYDFMGWATSKGGEVAYQPGGDYTANAAVTLYAVWELAYTAPRIASASIVRCDASGLPDDEGDHARLTATWSVDQTVSGNEGDRASISWREASSSSWSEATVIGLSGTSGAIDVVLGTFDVERSYEVRIHLADTHEGGGTTRLLTLSQAFFTIDLLVGGHGIAVGKPATRAGMLDIGLDVEVGGTLNGYEIEGESGNRWGIIPVVEANAGVMEIGQCVDFHASDGDTSDYIVRLQATQTGKLLVNGVEISLSGHGHAASDISSGTLPRSRGGTGQTGRSDGTITRNTTNCSTLGTSWVSHNGVTCTVSFIDAKITNALANNGNVVVATLPEGFRPRANMYVSCIEKAGLWARITASGEVRISNRTGASYAAGSTFTFSTGYDI